MTKTDSDIRWKQRLQNYTIALKQLENAVNLAASRQLNDLEIQGIIQAFEFNHELAWNVLKDYFEYQGNHSLTGSRDATREGFQKGLIDEGEIWMEMLKSRNLTSNTYNLSVAKDIFQKIVSIYFSEFKKLETKMLSLSKV
ncbi:MAG: nucleotidyltransferase substrate binding protein [Bacteriovoracaceae bacterium]|nr:nucleotidyltransferase substrate binding protein [Bacteriovoracaceae bacterium]